MATDPHASAHGCTNAAQSRLYRHEKPPHAVVHHAGIGLSRAAASRENIAIVATPNAGRQGGFRFADYGKRTSVCGERRPRVEPDHPPIG